MWTCWTACYVIDQVVQVPQVKFRLWTTEPIFVCVYCRYVTVYSVKRAIDNCIRHGCCSCNNIHHCVHDDGGTGQCYVFADPDRLIDCDDIRHGCESSREQCSRQRKLPDSQAAATISVIGAHLFSVLGRPPAEPRRRQRHWVKHRTIWSNGGGGSGRPVFVRPDLRSVDNGPSDPDQYWDFVLGSGTFRRRRRNPKYIRARRDVTSAVSPESPWGPVFDVLGRRVNVKDGTNVADFQRAAEALARSPDVISHVTIGLDVGGFL